MLDVLRDAPLGQVLNKLSRGRILPYPDQLPGYQIPQRYLLRPAVVANNTINGFQSSSSVNTRVSSRLHAQSTPVLQIKEKEKNSSASYPDDDDGGGVTPVEIDSTLEAGHREKHVGHHASPDRLAIEELPLEELKDPYIVDWDGPDDPDNPRNWSPAKRGFVLLCICVLTFSVYIGSSIYTASIPGLKEQYGASNVVATLGLTLYVFAYGVGPMFLSPLQELPTLGRNTVYVLGLYMFVLFQVGAARVDNIPGLLVLRFLTGFMASPALATGGASVGDMYPEMHMPYVLGMWAMAATVGPTLGPIVGGFAAQANGWRWPMYELLWTSGFAALWVTLFLPETLSDTILLKRAARLRALTGNEKLKSWSEVKQSQMTLGEVAREFLLRPFQLMIEPAVFVLNTYIGLAYAIFYLWFEAFPLVFGDIYGFNLGQQGLAYMGLIVTAFIAYPSYCAWNYYYLNPKWERDGELAPEKSLLLACMTGFIIPISLFIFGWTSRANVHWIAPVIGAGLYMPAIYILFQCGFMYLPQAYPDHVASIFAANDFFRSGTASVFPLFGKFFFDRLGLGPGCSLLAGLGLVMIPLLYLIMKKGAHLRAMSKYATSRKFKGDPEF